MRPDYCSLADYEAWFEGECNKLALDPGFEVVGPFTEASGEPGVAPWFSDLAIIYPDSMYVRVTEEYCRAAKRDGGGGRLIHFSYHYGPASKRRDSFGFPQFIDDCDLRIDIALRGGRHIHFRGEDHIPEERIKGLNFASIEPFEFIRAVHQHRSTKDSTMDQILRFTVEPKQ